MAESDRSERGVEPSAWRRQLVELAVFLLLIVPSMALSFLIDVENVSFTLLAWSNILRDLALLGLVLYFVWSAGESFTRIGLRFDRVGREIVVGLALFVPFYFAAGMLAALLHLLGLPPPQPTPGYLVPHGVGGYVLALLFLLVVAVAEETIFRGYLLLRLGNLTAHTPTAVVLSAVIFSIGHGYQGPTGVAVVGGLGVLFALVYLWRGSLIAPIVMHFLQNFIGIILAPLLTGP